MAADDQGGARGHGASALRHPTRTVEHEVEHVLDVARQGESPKTPAILIAGVALTVVSIFTVVLVLAWGTAYLVTGRTGAHLPKVEPLPTTTTQTAGTPAAVAVPRIRA